MKKLPAIIAAFVTTLVVGVIIFVIGVNALFNPNSVQASNSPTDPAASTSAVTGAQDQAVSANSSAAAASVQVAQIQQLQNRVNEYQNREKTLTSQLQQSQQQLQLVNQQLTQYQQVLDQLQQIGLIRIGQDGSISVGRGFRGGGDNN